MLAILFLPILIIAAVIKIDSKGPVMFRQIRITQYGKKFRIYKFRTMIPDAEAAGSQVTAKNDMRVTGAGKFLRKYRFDEIPQLLNVIAGDMSFVGTRPEVVKYVGHYTDEMTATLLLPAGITSEASILYKDEEKLLSDAENTDAVYIEKILPQKMKYNLDAIEQFGFFSDIKTMLRTVAAVVKKNEN